MASYLSFRSVVVDLKIVLDDKEEVARAGGWIRGKVVVHVEKGNIGSEVELTLRGKEKSTRKKGPVDLCHHHEFFSNSIKLRDPHRKVLEPGESTLPFALELPECLPSSSVHRIGLDSVGFIVQYKLTAQLGNFSQSMPVGIAAAPLKCGNSSYIVHPQQQGIFSMNGTNQGSLTTAASIQNTNIRKGEKVRVAVACRNDSLVKVQRVEAKVVELLNWGSHEGYAKRRDNKQTLVKLENIDLPGLQKENDTSTSFVDSNYRTVEEMREVDTAIRNDLVSGLNEIEMVVPLKARDSYPGTLIDIRHYLKITFITRNPFFGAQPSIKIPLKIGLPEEIPRVYAYDDSSNLEKIAITKRTKQQPDLPVVAAVPITPTGQDYDYRATGHHDQIYKGISSDEKGYGQMERQVEQIPTRAVLTESGKDLEITLHDLVPMLPSN